MPTDTEVQLLRDPDVFPSDDVVAQALKNSFKVYQIFTQKLPEYEIQIEWQYYNDGKMWLGKCTHKKKTVFWLSIWEGFFKVTIYFNEKTREGVYDLPVSDDIKKMITDAKPIGKLIPLLMRVDAGVTLDDIYALIEYKRSIK